MKTLISFLMFFVAATLTDQTSKEYESLRILIKEIIIETDAYQEKDVYSTETAPLNYVLKLPSYSSFDLVNMKLKSIYDKHPNVSIAIPWKELSAANNTFIQSTITINDSIYVIVLYREGNDQKNLLVAGCYDKNAQKIIFK